MSNLELSALSDAELIANLRAYQSEINRRAIIKQIPQEISNLAQQGREIGVEEQVMIEAVTKHP